MKITVFAAGSRGDIQPCVVVSKGLQQAGDQVRLAAPEDFAAFAQEHAVDFTPLRGDVQQIMASDTGRRFMESGGANPLRSIRAVRKMIAPVIMQMAEDAYAACRDADALLCLGVFSAFGHAIAEALRLPIVHIEPTPLLPTRAFPAPSWPIQRNLGGVHNYLSGVAMLRALWLWYSPFVNEFRKRLGLSPYRAADFHRALRATPMVSAYSPRLIPHPVDWPAHIHVTGYLFLDTAADWQPSPALETFLAAGAPPVCIGFGSMAGRHPEALARLALDALSMSGQRGLLLTGWGGLRTASTAGNVFVVDSAPHSWLFPRMAAVVHHGGAGATAEGVRAGVPTVVAPFVLDQPFWGARIHALGLGPAPIPQKKLTAERLADAITTAITDHEMRQRARAWGEIVRAEQGVHNAVEVIRRCFGGPDGAQEGRSHEA
ncbi:MAG: glycosyltransferase family 1 protein [Caldilineaceae bacterium]|jgi:UDP:flavonoid glycosyltransferase YjiC (YdhE family)|nr:glycosyltransferase family 1 protein [Caldilineaceae bacterium]